MLDVPAVVRRPVGLGLMSPVENARRLSANACADDNDGERPVVEAADEDAEEEEIEGRAGATRPRPRLASLRARMAAGSRWVLPNVSVLGDLLKTLFGNWVLLNLFHK